jgi:hypothetical protein
VTVALIFFNDFNGRLAVTLDPLGEYHGTDNNSGFKLVFQPAQAFI